MILEIIKREQSLLKMFTGDPHHEAPCGLTLRGCGPGRQRRGAERKNCKWSQSLAAPARSKACRKAPDWTGPGPFFAQQKPLRRRAFDGAATENSAQKPHGGLNFGRVVIYFIRCERFE